MRDVTRDAAKVTSIHSPFSVALPSCQQVFGSPSIALAGWNLARSPTTDDAVAPWSASGTETAGPADDPAAPDAPPEARGAPDEDVDGRTAREGFVLAADEALPRRSDPPATTATPTTIPITPTITSHRSTPPPLPEAAGSVPGVRAFTVAGWFGAATAAAIWSALADGTPAVSGSFVPHDWQNVRPGSFAIPHAGHRVSRPATDGGGAERAPAPAAPEAVAAGGPASGSTPDEGPAGGATTGTSPGD